MNGTKNLFFNNIFLQCFLFANFVSNTVCLINVSHSNHDNEETDIKDIVDHHHMIFSHDKIHDHIQIHVHDNHIHDEDHNIHNQAQLLQIFYHDNDHEGVHIHDIRIHSLGENHGEDA